jgi:GST-like protein
MIRIHVAPTPNGRKVTIALEELGLPYETVTLDLGSDEQKSETFLALSPNHKIPVLEEGERVIWESGAILLYLGDEHDPEGRILPKAHRWEAIQYAFFQTGGVGPNLGRLAAQVQRPEAERNAEMIKIFSEEMDRLLGVIDRILSDGRPYLATEYSIGDIMHYPWLHPLLGLGAPMIANRTRVVDWMKRIEARPAVKRGMEACG